MATLLSDDFNRANSTSVVGNPQIGPSPVVYAGTMGISSNQLYPPSTPAIIGWNLGTPDVELSATANTLSSASPVGLMLGYVSATSYYYVAFTAGATGATVLYKVEPGGFATLYVSTVVIPAANGDTVKVHHRAGVIRAYVNGTLVLRHTLDAPITSTIHGVRLPQATPKADNLLGTDAPVITEPTTAGVTVTDATLTAGAADLTDPPSAFLYRGRDTKTLDLAPGA